MIETKFKQTEIGLIPEDWKVVSLGKVISFLPNNTLSRDYLSKDGLIKNIHYGDVLIKYGAVLDVSNTCIPAVNTKLIPLFTPNQYAKNGDIIIADTAEDDTVCKTTELFNIKSTKVVSGLHTMWGRPESGIFISKYLGYFMNSAFYHNQVLPLIQGTKVSSVAKSAIKSTILVLPPATEQSNIANILTDIDSLLLALDNLIAKKKAIKEGTMQQLLTGKKRLKGFNEPWVEKRLGEVTETSSGGTPLRSIAHYYDGTINWFTTGELNDGFLYKSQEQISNDAIKNSSAKIFPKDTVLMAMYGATIGKLGILKEPSATNQACCAFFCKKIDEMFLFYLLRKNREKIIEKSCGAGQPNISQNIIKELTFRIPCEIKEQQAIAQVLTNIDYEISALEAKRKKYESVKQGMMQQLLTGKIRLTRKQEAKDYCLSESKYDYCMVAEPQSH